MKTIVSLLFSILSFSLLAQPWKHGPVRPSANGHYLQHADGTPFFWLGDTGWELFHRLDKKEMAHYFSVRQQQRFNVIQAVVLAEFDGLRIPNRYGQVPFIDTNPDKPNKAYFDFMDSVIDLAAQHNLYIALLPTWGDKVTKLWGIGPVVFDSANAYRYGKFLADRYKTKPNVLWMLGGDRPAKNDSADWRPVWRAMAEGIMQGALGKAFITYHTWGGHSTSENLHNELWLHMNTMQSGHGGGHDVPVWGMVTRDYLIKPAKPTLDAEPNYEDHPVNPWPKWDSTLGYYRDYDVRKQCYRSVFAGAAGVTYGHHAVWQFWNGREEKINHADRWWTDAISRPGAMQIGFLKQLLLSRNPLHRVPDSTLIVAGNGKKGEALVAYRDSLNNYAMIYLPVGKNVAVNTSFITNKKIAISWINPRTGAVKKLALKDRSPIMSFTPPQVGVGFDWVLLLEDANANLPALIIHSPNGK